MKSLLIMFSVLGATLAHANPAILGSWHSIDPIYSDDEMKIHADITFKPQTAVVVSKCSFKGGAKLSASLETKVTYTPTALKMTENKDNVSTDDAGNQCPVFSRAADVAYTLDKDGVLTLNYEEGGLIVRMKR